MKMSLLYPDGVQTKKPLEADQPGVGKIGPRTIYHFSLDSVFTTICEEERIRSNFLKVLSLPAQTGAMIEYRQQILREFDAHNDFLTEFSDMFNRFSELRDSHDRERQAMMRQISGSSAGAAAQTLKSLLKSNAVTLKRCLDFVRSLSDLFARHRIGGDESRATGLKRLNREATELTKSSAFKQLIDLCSRFEKLGLSDDLAFSLRLGESGQIEECYLIDQKLLKIVDNEMQSKLLGFFKREIDTRNSNCVRVHLLEDASYDKMVVVPLQFLSDLFDSMCEQIFEKYAYIATEMSFYLVANRYLRYCKSVGIALSYPNVSENNAYEIRGLRDLPLLVETEKVSTIIPNNVGGDTRTGMIVFGENNSGKTTYLRSAGVAQILAQAGLPIPADFAQLPICSQIMSQFSEAEKEFEMGNNAGRFEQEVRELASVVDELQPGAIVFLNETFQTTAYDEGAEGLLHILNYFSERGIRFLLVSHLRQLEGRMDPASVGVLRTHPGYHVLPDQV